MKIGICGTGDISHLFVKSSEPVESIEISGVYHREYAEAEPFAQQYAIPFYTDSYKQLLQECECVYIGLPNSLHYSFSKEAILEGKHVLIEKPVTSHGREFKELIQLAEEQQVMILEVNRVMFLPHFKWIKEKMKDFQQQKMIHLSFCKQSRKYFDYLEGKNPNVFTTQFSGGALYDLGVYGIHFIVELLGKPEKVSYQCHLLDSGVDGFGILTLEYKDCIASIQNSKITHGLSNMVIEAVEGRIQADTAVSILKELVYFDGKESQLIADQKYNAFTYFLMNAMEIIEKKDISRYQQMLDQSALVLQIMEEARRQNNIVFACDNQK